jgi:hypothetical protein
MERPLDWLARMQHDPSTAREDAMAYSRDSKSSAVRAQLDHPVIDGDGHGLEPVPIFLDYLRQLAGPSVAERFVKKATEHTALNPDFFKGTVVEDAVAKELAR